jgi:hypothetical protein
MINIVEFQMYVQLLHLLLQKKCYEVELVDHGMDIADFVINIFDNT